MQTSKTGTVTRPNGVTLLGPGPYVHCPACGKQIHFITTTSGKKMPCEMDLKVGNERITLVTHDGRTIRKAGSEISGYEPHWGYCYRGSKRPDGVNQLIVKGGAR